MAGSVRDLRRRIRSVKSTQKITRAMKLVAASKLRRAQADMENARPYAAGIRDLLASLRSRVGTDAHPLLVPRVGRKTLLVVMTSDRGLAGSFNTNVIKAAMAYLRKNASAGGEREVTLHIVGRKARDFFKRRSFPVRRVEADVFGKLDFTVSKRIAQDLMTAFADEGFDEVVILSNRFKTLMSQDLVFDRLLPAGGAEPTASETAAGGAAPQADYIYEPDAETLLGAIVPRAVEVAVHQALLESYASEMGARMVAMESATKNAGEMIDRLTLLMNRTRQAAITKELIEIVSGASALAATD